MQRPKRSVLVGHRAIGRARRSRRMDEYDSRIGCRGRHLRTDRYRCFVRLALCRASPVDRPLPVGSLDRLGASLRQDHSGLDDRLRGSIRGCRRMARGGPSDLARDPARLPALHSPRILAVRGCWRHSPERKPDRQPEDQRDDPPLWNPSRERAGNDGCRNAAHSAADPRQSGASPQHARVRLLHLPGRKHRRIADAARRPAPVFGLPARASTSSGPPGSCLPRWRSPARFSSWSLF